MKFSMCAPESLSLSGELFYYMASRSLCQQLFYLFSDFFSAGLKTPSLPIRAPCPAVSVTQPLYITKPIPPCQLLFSFRPFIFYDIIYDYYLRLFHFCFSSRCRQRRGAAQRRHPAGAAAAARGKMSGAVLSSSGLVPTNSQANTF